MTWSEGRTTRTSSGSAIRAAATTAGAVFRPDGSTRIVAPSRSPVGQRSLHCKKLIAAGHHDDGRAQAEFVHPAQRRLEQRLTEKLEELLGGVLVERGQRRVPIPPERTTGRTVGFTWRGYPLAGAVATLLDADAASSSVWTPRSRCSRIRHRSAGRCRSHPGLRRTHARVRSCCGRRRIGPRRATRSSHLPVRGRRRTAAPGLARAMPVSSTWR